MRSLPYAFESTVLSYFQSKTCFKIAATVASITGKRLIIMMLCILGKISHVKQGKINTNKSNTHTDTL